MKLSFLSPALFLLVYSILSGAGMTAHADSLITLPDPVSLSFPKLIERILDIFLIFAVFIEVLLIVYVGFLFLTSGGDPGKRSVAHRVFKSAVIGFLIICAAWLPAAALRAILIYGPSTPPPTPPPPPIDVIAPSIPGSLTATPISSSQIDLSWLPSTDNVAVIGYKVYRGGSEIATVTGTTHNDTGLSPSTAYSYTVVALDAAGNVSSASASATATTLAAPPSPKIYVVDASVINTYPVNQRIMFTSLQGIVNKNGPAGPLIFYKLTPRDQLWLDGVVAESGLAVENVTDLWALLALTRPYYNGFVSYTPSPYNCQPPGEAACTLDNKNNFASMNVALSIAGIEKGLVVDKTDSALVNGLVSVLGLSEIINVTGRDYTWLLNTYPRRAELNRNIAVMLQNNISFGTANPRDFAIKNNTIVYYEYIKHVTDDTSYWWDAAHKTLHTVIPAVLSYLNTGAQIWGWGCTSGAGCNTGESDFVNYNSQSNKVTIGSDQTSNLSVYSLFPETIAAKKTRALTDYDKGKDKHYVSIIFSDGDNTNIWLDYQLSTTPPRFSDPRRGEVPVGWTVPPIAADYMPFVLNWYIANGMPADDFVMGPSGAGYVYPRMVSSKPWFASLTDSFAAKTGIRTAVLFEYNCNIPTDHDAASCSQGFTHANLGYYTSQPNIDGLFFYAQDYGFPPFGAVTWSNGKPVFSTQPFRYGSGPTAQQIANNIKNRTIVGNNAPEFSVIYSQLWQSPYTDAVDLRDEILNSLAAAGKSSDSVIIVRPDEIVALAKKYAAP